MSYLPADLDPIAAKTVFAGALLRYPHEAFKAACVVFPDHMQHALFIMQNWVHDPFVREEQQRLLQELGEEAFLPSKFELSHEVYHMAATANETEDKIKAFRLYAELQGHITKAPTTNVNIDNSTKVLRVSAPDPDEVRKRQAKLLEEMAEDAR